MSKSVLFELNILLEEMYLKTSLQDANFLPNLRSLFLTTKTILKNAESAFSCPTTEYWPGKGILKQGMFTLMQPSPINPISDMYSIVRIHMAG